MIVLNEKEPRNTNAKKLQELEKFLIKRNMVIRQRHQCIKIIFDDKKVYEVQDVESGEPSDQLPRIFESEKLVLSE